MPWRKNEENKNYKKIQPEEIQAGGNQVGCHSTGNRFSIDNWKGVLPRHGILYRYEKGSNFSILEQKNESDFNAEIIHPDSASPRTELIVNFSRYGDTISTESDYKLTLDNKIEYRIYEIEQGTGETGCRVTGKVNQCDLFFSYGFDFSKKCGIPVKSG